MMKYALYVITRESKNNMKKRKIIISIIVVVAIIGVALFLYFSQGDWCERQGWSGEYNKDSVLMEGIEGMELKCSVNTRINYSYAIKSGGSELKITRDIEGKDVVKSITVTEENSNGTITFDNEEPEIYYLHETALSKDSDYFTEGSYEEYQSKWRQLLLKLAFRFGKDME